MKRAVLFLALLMLTTTLTLSADNRSSRINWLTNYDDAVQQSTKSSKPILLFFTGSDWCGWCIKLEDESLNTQEFVDAAGDKFIFVKLDFPLNRPLAPQMTAQNKRLQKQYSVTGFPAIIILNSQQQKIGATGYRPGGGKQYASHLQKIVDDSAMYKQKVDSMGNQNFSSTELKHLYEQAITYNQLQDIQQILSVGMKSDQKHFFLIERYRHLAESGKVQTKEAVAIKQQLLLSDPHNTRLTYYQLAIIDFEEACRDSTQANSAPEYAVAPLVEYIDKFGSKDKVNVWRLQMIISQVFFEKNKLPEALMHAKFSFQTAPSTVQPEIATAIKNMQSLQNLSLN